MSIPNPDVDTEVAIVGGGPAGLMLAIELGCRGVPCVLLEEDAHTIQVPKANATSARTMEHYRRRGFAHRVRASGLAADHPQDVAYRTRGAGVELARFAIPSRAEAAAGLSVGDYGEAAWPTPELPHRGQQMVIEPILREEAGRFSSVDLRWGHRVTAIEPGQADGEGVSLTVTPNAAGERPEPYALRARYLVGCDGARSAVRKHIGVAFEGRSKEAREFFGGQMVSVYLRSSDLARVMGGRPAWQTWIVNPQRRGIVVAINGVDTFVIGAQLAAGQSAEGLDLQALFDTLIGARFAFEVLHTGTWLAGYMLVAERFRSGRVFLAGDAAHLFTPTGGMGYNTSIDDVVNLGWKLAAAVQGWGGEALLASYEAERRPIAQRNTAFARRMADSIGHMPVPADLEAAGAAGEAARQALGEALLAHCRQEFNIPGLQLGLRYAHSPVLPPLAPGEVAPPDDPNHCVAGGWPGARAPHLRRGTGSLLDQFGRDLTLLVLGPRAAGAVPGWQQAAAALGVPLQLLRDGGDDARQLYGAPLVLVRPDHHIGWRGDAQADPVAVLALVCGR